MTLEPSDFYDDEELARAQLASFRLRARMYRTEIIELPDGQFYWSLFIRSSGERVNGGLNASWREAQLAAGQAIAWNRTSIWDVSAASFWTERENG